MTHLDDSAMFAGDWRYYVRRLPSVTMWYRGAISQFLRKA